MTRAVARQILFAAISAIAVVLLSSCGTTSPHVTRQLPAFEPPIAKADIQTVRTTAYTHTEADHVAYGNHNALGGELRAATIPRARRAEYTPRVLPIALNAVTEYQFGAESSSANDEDKPVRKAKAVKSEKSPKSKPEKSSKESESAKHETAKHDATKKSKEKKVAKTEKEKARDDKKLKSAKRAVAVKKPSKPVIGSAAADWARWPYGTTFRILSTGQVYRVDDIGWALAGRNTIDLYMPNSHEMNTWGTRTEKIEIMKWGDQEQSAHLLAARSDYKHVRRMLLELSGRYDEAAQLQ